MKLRLAKKLLSFDWYDGVYCIDVRHSLEERDAAGRRVDKWKRNKAKRDTPPRAQDAANGAGTALTGLDNATKTTQQELV